MKQEKKGTEFETYQDFFYSAIHDYLTLHKEIVETEQGKKLHDFVVETYAAEFPGDKSEEKTLEIGAFLDSSSACRIKLIEGEIEKIKPIVDILLRGI